MLTISRILHTIFYLYASERLIDLIPAILKIDLGLVQCWTLIELSLHITESINLYNARYS